MTRYARLRERLSGDTALELGVPDAATDGEQLRVHTELRRRWAVAVVMAGGYAPDVDRIVEIHAHTVREAARTAPRPT